MRPDANAQHRLVALIRAALGTDSSFCVRRVGKQIDCTNRSVSISPSGHRAGDLPSDHWSVSPSVSAMQCVWCAVSAMQCTLVHSRSCLACMQQKESARREWRTVCRQTPNESHHSALSQLHHSLPVAAAFCTQTLPHYTKLCLPATNSTSLIPLLCMCPYSST